MTAAVEQVRDAAAGNAKALGLIADVRDPAALAAAAASVAAELGDVYGLIASAGIAGAAKAEDMTLEELNNVFAVNVGGVLSTCQAFVRGMLARRSGSIVLIGSVNSLGGQPGRMHYTASKHAVLGMVKNLAIEWGRYGVRVNGIAPGPGGHAAASPERAADVLRERLRRPHTARPPRARRRDRERFAHALVRRRQLRERCDARGRRRHDGRPLHATTGR